MAHLRLEISYYTIYLRTEFRWRQGPEVAKLDTSSKPQRIWWMHVALAAWLAAWRGGIVSAAAAESETPVPQYEIVAMMHMHCTACHGARVKEGGLDLR